MGKHTRGMEPFNLAVDLSEEIDAEIDPAAPVPSIPVSFERYVGSSLTAASFSPIVEAATDVVIARHNPRVTLSAQQAMLRGADRAMQERIADIEATRAEEQNYTL